MKAQDAIDFISKHEVPKDKKTTYAQFVCDHRPLKKEEWRVQIVVGGDKLHYNADAGSPTANLLETKILLNSTISDAHKGARFCTADLKDHFLGSPMKEPEFMRVHISKFPKDIIERYNLYDKMDDQGFVYIRIRKGMYGLRQAAILAYNNIVRLLEPHGYAPVPGTQGIWKHKDRPVRFCLCVDDFGIKYFDKKDVQHLLQALAAHYEYTIDWTGQNYCGLNIKWNYEARWVEVSINGYIKNLLNRLNHPLPTRPVHSPHEWLAPVYGKNRQYAKDPDSSPLLDTDDTTFVQSTVGSLLYYGRAVEHPILVALNEISTQQTHPTQKVMKKVKQLLDFVSTYPDATLRYYASNMILHVDSDAAYLVLPHAKSRVGGYFYLSSTPPTNINNIPKPMRNAPILIKCSTLKHVVASAAEAECG